MWAESNLPFCGIDQGETTVKIFNIHAPVMIILMRLDMGVLETEYVAISETAVKDGIWIRLTRIGFLALSMLQARHVRY